MSYGIMTYDSDNKVSLNTNYNTLKILKELKINATSARTGNITFNHTLFSKQTPFYIIRPLLTHTDVGNIISITFSGHQCTVSFSIDSHNLRPLGLSSYIVIIGVH